MLSCFGLPHHNPAIDLVEANNYFNKVDDKTKLDGLNLNKFYTFVLTQFEKKPLDLFGDRFIGADTIQAFCDACNALDILVSDKQLIKKKRFAKFVCLNLLQKDLMQSGDFIQKLQTLHEDVKEENSPNASLLSVILQVAGHFDLIKIES